MFEQKQLEPKLSPEIESIINRSNNEKDIKAKTDEVVRVKLKIMSMLTSNQDLLHALHKEDTFEEINGDTYRNVCIFDRLKLPNLKDEVKNYICFAVGESYGGNYGMRTIIFRTVCHEDEINTDWGVSRHDLLALIIKKEFNWTQNFGVHLELSSDLEYSTNDGYSYREIQYTVNSTNDLYSKVNNRGR